VFLDIEPEKLFAFFDRYNDAQAEELVKPYIAKWTDVSGRVSKVDTELLPLRTGDKELRYGINVFIAGKRKDNRKNTSTQAIFDNPRWIERAKVLKRDEDITVRGQIKLIWGFGFYLEHCEIVE